jgi:hypothetical protein
LQRVILGFLFAILGAGFSQLAGQTQVRLRTQSQDVDFAAAPSTRPVKLGVSFPATCSVGALFYKVDAQPGDNLYGCTAANTWNQLTGGRDQFQLPRIQLQGSAISVGANCATSICAIRFGSDVRVLAQPGTASAPVYSGTANSTVYFYVGTSGNLLAGIDGALVTGMTTSNMTLVSGIAAFPAGVYPLGTCVVNGTGFASCTEYRVSGGLDLLVNADSSVIVTANSGNGRQSVAVNPATVFLTTADSDMSGLNLVNYRRLTINLPNEATTGTQLNRLVALAGSVARTATTASEDHLIGVCSDSCGLAGIARITTGGIAACAFDAAVTAGDYIQPSKATAGSCASAGTTRPASGAVLGYAMTTSTGPGTFDVLLEPGVSHPAAQAVSYPYQTTQMAEDMARPIQNAKLVALSAAGLAGLAAMGSSGRLLGIGLASTGVASQIITRGTTSCIFDGAATTGHYFQVSATTDGACTDAGPTRPTSGQVLGYVLSSITAAGPASVLWEPGQ